MTDPVVGLVLEGRYRLEERVARGGMSTVYTATDLRLHRTVAVKIMADHLVHDPTFRAGAGAGCAQLRTTSSGRRAQNARACARRVTSVCRSSRSAWTGVPGSVSSSRNSQSKASSSE